MGSTIASLHTNKLHSDNKSNLFISPTKLAKYPTNTISYTVLCCNRLIMLFTQIIHKKINIFSLIVQYLEKCSGVVQQLASRGWHRVNRQEE